MMRPVLMFIFLLFFSISNCYSQHVVSILDFDYEPGKRNNVLPALNKALEECKLYDSAILMFPKGRYDFWPIDSDSHKVSIGFHLKQMKNIIVEGNDSEFIFHGRRMKIAEVDSSVNVVFMNFSVDWERPYISQATIEGVSDDHLDVKIDREEYPFVIENNKIMFLGEDWKMPVITGYNNLYDKDTQEIVYNTWDNPLGDIFSQDAEELSNGTIRFHGQTPMRPDFGTYVTLYHERYASLGFHIRNSKDVVLKDLKIYHALGHGVLGERSENITMDNASMLVNEKKGRVFSVVADASHFKNCKGLIKVTNCAHTGQGDDFINIHGRHTNVFKIIDNRTIVGHDKELGRLNDTGDEVWYIDGATAQRGGVNTIESREPYYEDGKLIGQKYTFIRPFSDELKENDFIENKTWTAQVIIRNNKILKKNRARGILVTTPQSVLIEDNYFRSAGTAILIEGDINRWFESGANTDVTIQNNIFENCLTSGNRDGNSDQWGDAVITITPSYKPESRNDQPYHNNIRIQDNTFHVFDAPLVRARLVKNLSFTGNQIIKTSTYRPYAWQQSAFMLDGCRNVVVKGNLVDRDYITRDISIKNMTKGDVKHKGFTVKYVDK